MKIRTLFAFLISIVLISALTLQKASADHCSILDVFCHIGDDDSGGSSGGGSLPDPLGGVTGIINSMSSTVNGISGDVNNLVEDVTAIKNDVEDFGTDLSNEGNRIITDINNGINSLDNLFYSLTGDIGKLLGGVDPTAVYGVLSQELRNESNCSQLPSRLDEINDRVLDTITSSTNNTTLSFIGELRSKLNFISFSNMNLRGIDPDTATLDDLHEYKQLTVRPLMLLKDSSKSILKVPFAVGGAIAVTCAEVTAIRIIQRTAKNREIENIHNVLGNEKLKNLLYMMPEDKGGKIERVAEVLEDTITEFESLNPRNADKAYREYHRGLSEYEMGNYARAFKHYRKSYKELTKFGDWDDD